MQHRRYPAAREFARITDLTGTDPARVLRRARMPADFLIRPSRGVTAEVFFRLWTALIDEMADPLAALRLADAVVGHEIDSPACQALVVSPDLLTAMERLALFRQVRAPVRGAMQRRGDQVIVTAEPLVPGTRIPPSLHLMQFAWLLRMIERLTGAPVQALATTLPGLPPGLPARFGRLAVGPAEMALSLADAQRPILSRDDAVWARTEAALLRDRAAPLADRVRAVLRDFLPAGEARAQAVAEELFLSQRTFQRQLAAEGTSYQAVLDDMRAGMARDYLAGTDLSTEEIAYLLAYRDTSSFFRAFQNWTGTTPGALRRQAA